MAESAPDRNQPRTHRRALHNLPAAGFERLLTQNIHPPTRDQRTWDSFLAPDTVARTKSTLIAMQDRTDRAIEGHNRDLSALQVECRQRGPEGRDTYVAAKAAFDAWNFKARNFRRTVAGAIAEVDRHIGGKLDQAVSAIRDHQTANQQTGATASAHDLTLWQTANQLSAG